MKYNTKRREEIASFLMNNSERAFTSEQIACAVLDGDSGRSTVYRLLSELVADGCIRRITDGTRHVTYQYVGGEHCHHHLHLKCKGCGRLIHLDESTSREVEERLSTSGFTIDGGELLLGTCSDCGGAR